MNKKITHILLRSCLISCIFFLSYCTPSGLSAQTEHLHTREIDSLQQILAIHKNPGITIPAMKRLSLLFTQEPEELSILYQWLNESVKIDSIESTYEALNNIARFHYNNDQTDSLLYWVNIIDSLSASRNEYPNALFDVKCLYSQNILYDGDYEQVMTDAINLYKLASRLKQTYGQMRCTEALGLIYQTIRRDSDAIVTFQEGLDLLESLGGNLDTETRLISYQAECAVRTDMFKQTDKILARYRELIKKQENANETEGHNYLVKREYWILQLSYTTRYLRANDIEKAKLSLDTASMYTGYAAAENDYVKKYHLYTLASYQYKSGNLSAALKSINELLKVENLPEDYQLKADILKKQGKLKEAFELYGKIEEISQEKSNATFIRQINQLRTLHEMNDKEKQARELNINNQRMKHKQTQLIVSVLIILFLITVLYIVFIYYRRARQLKNELLKEKESLLLSQQNLNTEKEKAEEASRVKSAFVANMSHEIRTPLNAIVGFSGLQTDPSVTPEEVEEYATIIKNNTELLLNLINDVLDLSTLGSGDMNFTFNTYTLSECCLMALDSVRHRIPQDVKLTYTPAPGAIVVYTDKLRLQQLLTNLLTNAAKFTNEGEINLSFELIEEQKMVRITVTDTGIGIPLEKQPSIFNRFEKLDDFKSGAGLGLSICSVIAKRLGGYISIDSSYTNGARFVFLHPVKSN